MTEKQRGVLRGMSVGAAAAILVVLIGGLADPFGLGALPQSGALRLALGAGLVPGLFLAVSIGRLAGHRFFTPEDIDGSGLTEGSARARLLQALLQNTLEQSALALCAWLAWAALLPASALSAVPLAALCFGLGRVLFFAGYGRGAAGRAIGFTLTFYPSVLMLLCALAALLARLG